MTTTQTSGAFSQRLKGKLEPTKGGSVYLRRREPRFRMRKAGH